MKHLLAILLLALCAGCSSGEFNKRWKAPSAGASRWEGRWTSGHHKSPSNVPMGGRLRCVLEPAEGKKVTARFLANWLAFTHENVVTLEAKQPLARLERGLPVELGGTHMLPNIFGGLYRYDARIEGARFTARYSSKYDAGTFEMTRLLTNPTNIH